VATKRAKVQQGFSLLEMLVSLAVLLVISAPIFSAMVTSQETAVSTQMKGDMYFGIRGASELLAEEIGQAGSVGLPASTQLSAAVTPSAAAQNVVLTSAGGTNPVDSIFVGELLLVDGGVKEEQVAVTAVNSATSQITAVFTIAHVAGAPVNAIGVFSNGVMNTSTGSSLRLFGDINADGTLYYVQYDCDTVAGTLTRSSTPMLAAAKNSSAVLLSNLVANAGGAPCFAYTSTTVGTNTFTSDVGITLSLQTAFTDPQSGNYLQMPNNFLNVRPRNLLAGVELAKANVNSRIQPTPACGWGTC
jgi:prepilin-type N-terminal cleavage/methylation domain-containing protein